MLNLRKLAEAVGAIPVAALVDHKFQGLDLNTVIDLRATADKMEVMVADIESLLDGEDDELASLLGPVADLLRELSGMPPAVKSPG